MKNHLLGNTRALIDLTGERFGILTVTSRAEFNVGVQPAWNVVCDCGNEKTVQGRHLRNGGTKSCGCYRQAVAAGKGRERAGVYVTDSPTYHGAHNRIYTARGSACLYKCVDCGSQADDWSYNRSDPNELTELVVGKLLINYSASPEFYDPRCRMCHRSFDA